MSTPEKLLAEIGLTTADVYDLFFSGVETLPSLLSFIEWFYERLPKDARALDIGCGTGRLLHPLRAKGFDVSGLEPREEYRQRASQYAEVYEGDFHRMPASLTWDFLFAINGPFAYLTHWQDRESALSSCYAALKPGGWLLLDVPNFLYLLKNYQEPTWQMATHQSHQIRRKAQHGFHYAEALWHHEERVEWRSLQGPESYTGYTEHYTFAMISPQEIDMMLEKAGFSAIEFYADWKARTPSNTGENRILVAAQKPA